MKRSVVVVSMLACAGSSTPRATIAPPPPSATASIASSGSCTQNSDCAAEQVCGYAMKDACGATGACVPRGPLCNHMSPGCACSGQTFNMDCDGYPSGYVSKPMLYAGPCVARPVTGWSPSCPNGGTQCGDVCCAVGEQCCPGGMANSYYCRASTSFGSACSALP